MSRKESDTLWCPPNLDVFLNRWFSKYEEARASLESEGGFLLPYRHQFFICQEEAIRALGLDPHDDDWEKIGRDAARPSDEQAYQRLLRQRERAARQELG